jgi:hypothetical protein
LERLVARRARVNAVIARLAAGAMMAAVAAVCLQPGCAPQLRPPAGAPADSVDVVVLTEAHHMQDAIDTLVTWLAPGRVRVSHRGGDAVLDVEHDRFLLLDPAQQSYRESSLAEWEQRIRTAALTARAAADSAAAGAGAVPAADSLPALRFALAGRGDVIAGFPTERFHLYAERQLFPGEWEQLEQEIWVTTAIDLPAAAATAYRRMFTTLDWIDFDARVERPAGVRMRAVVKRRPRGAAAVTETEITDVVRVERRRVPVAVFAAPPGWQRVL